MKHSTTTNDKIKRAFISAAPVFHQIIKNKKKDS